MRSFPECRDCKLVAVAPLGAPRALRRRCDLTLSQLPAGGS